MACIVAGMAFSALTARSILERYGKLIGKEWRRVDLQGDDLEFMMEAWKRCPSYGKKGGCNVIQIGVKRNTGSGYGFRAIYI